jgi:hypothetical protein
MMSLLFVILTYANWFEVLGHLLLGIIDIYIIGPVRSNIFLT